MTEEQGISTDLRKLDKLLDDPGFLLLNDLVQAQVDDLQKQILFSRCTSFDSALEQEYKKGQLEGRLAWEATLQAYRSSLQIDLDNRKELENATDDGTTFADSAP